MGMAPLGPNALGPKCIFMEICLEMHLDPSAFGQNFAKRLLQWSKDPLLQ